MNSITVSALARQMEAMGSARYELGIGRRDSQGATRYVMLVTWDAGRMTWRERPSPRLSPVQSNTHSFEESVNRLIRWNCQGRDIFIHSPDLTLTLVDDIDRLTISTMQERGFEPACFTQTNRGDNYQAWLKHPCALDRETSTRAAEVLAEVFDGDRGAASWHQFGRLAGFTNRKPEYQSPITGEFPYVRLMGSQGAVYSEAERFLAGVKQTIELDRSHRKSAIAEVGTMTEVGRVNEVHHGELRSIESFRADPRYSGVGHRADFAFGLHAASCGLDDHQIEEAIRTRDLSHKGSPQRQDAYIKRTIEGAKSRVRNRVAMRIEDGEWKLL